MEEGWRRADLHVHTTCSFDVLPAMDLHPESLYEKALKMGMDYITFTDHDTVGAYELLGWDREKLISGVEMSVDDPEFAGHELHVNVFELDREEFFELQYFTNWIRKSSSFIPISKYFSVKCLKS